MRIPPRPGAHWTFNPPPGWTVAPGWEPPADWSGPEPHWPAAPPYWLWWTEPAHGVSPLQPHDPPAVGPYRIVGRLGAGGMGVVYAGVDTAGQRAAVKLIHAMHAEDKEFRVRFRREVAMLRRVRGACCVRILAADADAGLPWLATEYIAGRTLNEHVGAEGPLTGDGLYGLAAGLAEALVAVHAAEVVHRDLKPSNVMVSPDDPRLVDFGIARALDGTSLTGTGLVVGSPGWVSPEEFGGGPTGPAADVYGWGLVVVYAATGKQPYGTGRPEVLTYRVMREAVDTSAVPRELRPMVDRALAKEPGRRPTMPEVLAAVADAWRERHGEAGGRTRDPAGDVTDRLVRTWGVRAGAAEAWPSEPTSPRKSRLRRASPVIAVVVAVGLAGAVLLNALPDSAAQQHPAAQQQAPTGQDPSPTANSPTTSAPSSAVDLAAALDLALSVTPAATFSYTGGFTESTVSAQASGRLQRREALGDDEFDMRIEPFDVPAGHYVITGDSDLYSVDKPTKSPLLLQDQKSSTKNWYPFMVAGTAGPSVIHQLVLNTTEMHREGRTYTGVLPTNRTSGRLRLLLDSWLQGGEKDDSYFTYELTIDGSNRPTKFELVWKVPVSGSGVYENTFTTTYRGWKKTGDISVPAKG